MTFNACGNVNNVIGIKTSMFTTRIILRLSRPSTTTLGINHAGNAVFRHPTVGMRVLCGSYNAVKKRNAILR